ncbi:MAG: carboxyvinyl-carboxyphosphonate phosphorylmutase [Alphaproteobacteria bacterium]|nr:carboxyvinyl-carboxyphosphonate phosphorylmutase [Alphaproteobacteria bacterium]
MLKTLMNQQDILIAPGIYDALSGLIAQKSGAKALYLSGASIAYTRFGFSDIGLVSMSEVNDVISNVTDRVPTPLIVDADNGFGNALNVQRTVRLFERSGAAALQLEDQAMPKRCGHLQGKQLISKDEMVGKIKAATDARHHEHTLIIARTDARASEGFQSALDRAEAYCEAGADVLFFEAPQSIDELSQVASYFKGRIPLLANMVEGGKTPNLKASELEQLGYSIVIFPGGLVRNLAKQMDGYFSSLLKHGTNAPMMGQMHDFDALNDIIGTPELLAKGQEYAS